jgi:hypothetical protein
MSEAKDYQRDALGQIERLADYLNDVDAAHPDEDGTMPLPCDAAISLLSSLSKIIVGFGDAKRDAQAECDALQERLREAENASDKAMRIVIGTVQGQEEDLEEARHLLRTSLDAAEQHVHVGEEWMEKVKAYLSRPTPPKGEGK